MLNILSENYQKRLAKAVILCYAICEVKQCVFYKLSGDTWSFRVNDLNGCKRREWVTCSKSIPDIGAQGVRRVRII